MTTVSKSITVGTNTSTPSSGSAGVTNTGCGSTSPTVSMLSTIKMPMLSHSFVVNFAANTQGDIPINMMKQINSVDVNLVDKLLVLHIEQSLTGEEHAEIAAFIREPVAISVECLDTMGSVTHETTYCFTKAVDHQLTLAYASSAVAVHILTIEFQAAITFP